eukprot:TRINITY_DN7369_c0_g1_i1.p1 TRINITY_DN7369_c0_g1~~TRINITY_DN7369_c0_g1_i1.p1  ORF type:complete len:384 (+),score=70.98 TRINITY_DN7369_c0_g1_i1:85-1236(+)
MIRRPPRSTLSSSSAASDVYKRQVSTQSTGELVECTMEPGGGLGPPEVVHSADPDLDPLKKRRKLDEDAAAAAHHAAAAAAAAAAAVAVAAHTHTHAPFGSEANPIPTFAPGTIVAKPDEVADVMMGGHSKLGLATVTATLPPVHTEFSCLPGTVVPPILEHSPAGSIMGAPANNGGQHFALGGQVQHKPGGKKSRAQNKVSKPMTSYMYWLTENREKLEARFILELPELKGRLPNNTFNSKAGQLWRDMPDEERAPFKHKAQQERVLYKSIHGVDPCAHTKKPSTEKPATVPAVVVPAVVKPPALPLSHQPPPDLSAPKTTVPILLPDHDSHDALVKPLGDHRATLARITGLDCGAASAVLPGTPAESRNDTGVGIHPLFQY